MEKCNKSIEKLLEICEVLDNYGVNLFKIQLSKKIGNSMHDFLLSEIKQDGIDIEQIIDENELDGNFAFGSNMKKLRKFFYGSRTDFNITETQIERALELGIIIDENVYENKLRTLEILIANGVNIKKNVSKRVDNNATKRYNFKLFEINQEGIDIEKIIADNNLDRNFIIEDAKHNLRNLYKSNSKRLTVEQRKKIELLGIIEVEKKHPYLEAIEEYRSWVENHGDEPHTKRGAYIKNEENEYENNLAIRIGNVKAYVKTKEKKEVLSEEEREIIEKAKECGFIKPKRTYYLKLIDDIVTWQTRNNTTLLPKARAAERKLPAEKRSDEYGLGKRIENLQTSVLKKYQDISDEEFLELDSDIQEVIVRSAELGIGLKFDIIKRMRATVSKNIEFNQETRDELNLKIKEFIGKGKEEVK